MVGPRQIPASIDELVIGRTREAWKTSGVAVGPAATYRDI
jgi:hypothetical protein